LKKKEKLYKINWKKGFNIIIRINKGIIVSKYSLIIDNMITIYWFEFYITIDFNILSNKYQILNYNIISKYLISGIGINIKKLIILKSFH
jgi:hypothetical protein